MIFVNSQQSTAYKNISSLMASQEEILGFLPFTLAYPFSEKIHHVARRQGRGAQNASAGKELSREVLPASAERGGPIGRPPDCPSKAMTMFVGKERLARPDQEMTSAS
jgi:hypothetical protein